MSDACCLPLETASKLPWCKQYSLPKEQSEESIHGSDLINSNQYCILNGQIKCLRSKVASAVMQYLEKPGWNLHEIITPRSFGVQAKSYNYYKLQLYSRFNKKWKNRDQ